MLRIEVVRTLEVNGVEFSEREVNGTEVKVLETSNLVGPGMTVLDLVDCLESRISPALYLDVASRFVLQGAQPQ